MVPLLVLGQYIVYVKQKDKRDVMSRQDANEHL